MNEVEPTRVPDSCSSHTPREVSRDASLPVHHTTQPVGPTAIKTLKVDHFFEGFTHEQTNSIASSAKHFSSGGKKRYRRMPPPAIVKWESWQTPPGTPSDPNPLPYQSPAQIIQRMHNASEHLGQAKAQIELAMRELWHIREVEGFREEIAELYSRSHQAQKIVRRYIQDAAK